MAAAGAFGELGARPGGVETIAANAMKRRPAPLPFEARVVAPVIVKPRANEHGPDQRAVNDGGGGKFEHAAFCQPAR